MTSIQAAQKHIKHINSLVKAGTSFLFLNDNFYFFLHEM